MKRGTPYQPIGNPQAGHRPSNRSWIVKATAASTLVFVVWVLLVGPCRSTPCRSCALLQRHALPPASAAGGQQQEVLTGCARCAQAPSPARPGPQAVQASPAQERPLAATSGEATARLAAAAGQPAAKAADLLQAKPAQPIEPKVQPPKPAEPLLAEPAEPLPAKPAEPLPAKAAAARPDAPAWATASTRTSLIGSTPQDWMHLNSWPTTAEAMNNMTYQEWEQVSWKPSLLSHVQPAGDYVSFGKLKPWFGDVFPSSNLKEALEVRLYEWGGVGGTGPCSGAPALHCTHPHALCGTWCGDVKSMSRAESPFVGLTDQQCSLLSEHMCPASNALKMLAGWLPPACRPPHLPCPAPPRP